jgi:hypothetical protein
MAAPNMRFFEYMKIRIFGKAWMGSQLTDGGWQWGKPAAGLAVFRQKSWIVLI